jgi:hypothetical protein
MSCIVNWTMHSYSWKFIGFGGSNGDSNNGLGTDIIDESPVPDERLAVGECRSISADNEKGILCGRGEISMQSIAGAGEDEGNGGVVISSSYGVSTITHPQILDTELYLFHFQVQIDSRKTMTFEA